jgi:dephospho-CoA kinase
MYKVGLTGNFYSGYDAVAEMFEIKGIPVFDADVVLKFMINYSETHIQRIKEKLGNDIYKSALLDIKRLDTNQKIDDILDIVQLDLVKSYIKWCKKNYDSPYSIFKSAILFERKLNTSMDFNISVFKPKDQRRRSLTSFTSIPRMTIDTILNSEMDEFEKNGKSDYIIHNYESSYQDYKNGCEEQIICINKSIIKKVSSNFFDESGNIKSTTKQL